MIMDDVVQKDMVSYFFFLKAIDFLDDLLYNGEQFVFFRKERVVNV